MNTKGSMSQKLECGANTKIGASFTEALVPFILMSKKPMAKKIWRSHQRITHRKFFLQIELVDSCNVSLDNPTLMMPTKLSKYATKKHVKAITTRMGSKVIVNRLIFSLSYSTYSDKYYDKMG